MSKPTTGEDQVAVGLDLHALFREQGPKLVRFLRRRTSKADADDVLQQSFLRLVSLGPVRAEAIRSPHAYLRRAAANLMTDNAKAENRRLEDGVDDLEQSTPFGPDPIPGLEARDMLRRIEAIVARMPERRREIFLAHRIDGYSYAEIAARTGISVKGVEKQMSRAIAQIDRLATRR